MDFDKREQELKSALIEQWALWGQTTEQANEARKKITSIEHRIDELKRAREAEKKPDGEQ